MFKLKTLSLMFKLKNFYSVPSAFKASVQRNWGSDNENTKKK